jgi:hypothetical protein
LVEPNFEPPVAAFAISLWFRAEELSLEDDGQLIYGSFINAQNMFH